MMQKVNTILGQFSYKNINLLEVKENLKRTGRQHNEFNLRLNNLNKLDNLNDLNNNSLSKIKHNMTDMIISKSLTDRFQSRHNTITSNLSIKDENLNFLENKSNNSSSNNKLFNSVFKKFNFDDRMKNALERNKMLPLTLLKSSNAIQKYKFIN